MQCAETSASRGVVTIPLPRAGRPDTGDRAWGVVTRTGRLSGAVRPTPFDRSSAPPVRSAGNTTVGVGVIPPAQTLLLHQALHAAGADSTHYLLSGAGHGRLSLSRRQASQWTSLQLMTVIKDFLDRHLRT